MIVVFFLFCIFCLSWFSSRSSCSFISCIYFNLLVEVIVGGVYLIVFVVGGNLIMMDLDVSEGKLGYLVFKLGIEFFFFFVVIFVFIFIFGFWFGDMNYIWRSWMERYVGLRRIEICIFLFVFDDRIC